MELATTTETTTGTSGLLVVTPASLAGARDAGVFDTRYYTESEVEARITARLAQGVIPASVAVGSGSASVAADGTIAFTGCSWFAPNGMFDGLGMDNYLIYLDTEMAANVVYTRIRNAGVDYVTATYNRIGVITSFSAGPARTNLFGTTAFGYWNLQSTAAGTLSGEMLLSKPNSPGATQALLRSGAAASDRYKYEEYGQTTGKGDGFSISAGTGTLTGKLKVVKI